jgi:hypothetical protein
MSICTRFELINIRERTCKKIHVKAQAADSAIFTAHHPVITCESMFAYTTTCESPCRYTKSGIIIDGGAEAFSMFNCAWIFARNWFVIFTAMRRHATVKWITELYASCTQKTKIIIDNVPSKETSHVRIILFAI